MSKHDCPSCTCNEDKREAAAKKPKKDTVIRVVKKGHLFRGRKGGQLVEVPIDQEGHRSTLLATHSLHEHAALVDAARKKPENESKADSVAMAARYREELKGRRAREQEVAAKHATSPLEFGSRPPSSDLEPEGADNDPADLEPVGAPVEPTDLAGDDEKVTPPAKPHHEKREHTTKNERKKGR